MAVAPVPMTATRCPPGRRSNPSAPSGKTPRRTGRLPECPGRTAGQQSPPRTRRPAPVAARSPLIVTMFQRRARRPSPSARPCTRTGCARPHGACGRTSAGSPRSPAAARTAGSSTGSARRSRSRAATARRRRSPGTGCRARSRRGRALLQDHEVVKPRLLQRDPHPDTAEPGPDDHDPWHVWTITQDSAPGHDAHPGHIPPRCRRDGESQPSLSTLYSNIAPYRLILWRFIARFAIMFYKRSISRTDVVHASRTGPCGPRAGRGRRSGGPPRPAASRDRTHQVPWLTSMGNAALDAACAEAGFTPVSQPPAPPSAPPGSRSLACLDDNAGQRN